MARAAHSQEGSYLDIFKDEGAAGFNPSDYQIQLTRRVRGLPLWFSLAMHGTAKYEWAVEQGILLAKLAAQKLRKPLMLKWLFQKTCLVCCLEEKDGRLKTTENGLTKIWRKICTCNPNKVSASRRNGNGGTFLFY